MSQIVLTFIFTHTQLNMLRQDPNMDALIWDAISKGAKPAAIGDKVHYPFYQIAVDQMPDDLVEQMLAYGVEVALSGGLWVEVDNIKLDNLVSVSWPAARMPAPEDELGDRRQLQDYTAVIRGINNTSLVRCGYTLPGNTNFSSENVDTPKMVSLYQTAFPDAGLYYLNKKSAWQQANTEQV